MAKIYDIMMVERWTFLNAQRNPVDGYRVTFFVPELNVTDHVIIAEAAYNPDNVNAAIEDKITLHRQLITS